MTEGLGTLNALAVTDPFAETDRARPLSGVIGHRSGRRFEVASGW